jgi:hypothetical protein
MKKIFMTMCFAIALVLGITAMSFAEEQKPEQSIDPNITNLSATYPLANEVLPPLPVKPESLNDVKAVTAYLAAVEAYTKAAQKYIDGTTNDLNKVIAQRNMAVQNANKVVEECNAFFEANKKQK